MKEMTTFNLSRLIELENDYRYKISKLELDKTTLESDLKAHIETLDRTKKRYLWVLRDIKNYIAEINILTAPLEEQL